MKVCVYYEMEDYDFVLISQIARARGVTVQEFITNAIREYVKKLQSEWQQGQELTREPVKPKKEGKKG